MLVTEAEAISAIENDQKSLETSHSGPHCESSTGKRRQLHANNHLVFNSVDRSLFDLEIRVGKVIAVRPHDNAEHLQVNEVNFGDSLGHKIIVTGRKGKRAISSWT